MARLSRYIAVILVISILIIVESISAQTIPKPSVPEFTIKYIEHSYNIAPTYTIDPYTGQTQMTSTGSTVIVKNIEVVIKNQAFSSYQTADGNYTQLCYYIRAKGAYEKWITDSIYEGGNVLDYNNSIQIPASNSDHTILTFPLDRWNIKPGGQIDFQIKAVIAKFYTVHSDILYFPDYLGSIVVSEGDWSSTQTLTIPANYASPTPSNTSVSPSPTIPEFPYLTTIPLLLSVLAVALAFRIKKSKTKNML